MTDPAKAVITQVKAPKAPIIVLCFVILTAVVAGYMFFLNQKDAVRKGKKDDILIVSDLKANQIARWRDERLNDAEDLLLEFMDNVRPGKAGFLENRKLLSSEKVLLHEGSEYKNIFVIDASMKVRAVGGNPESIGSYALSLAGKAMKDKKVIFGDLNRNEKNGEIDLDISAPIVYPGADAAAGAIILRIDPNNYLYPFLTSRPVKGETFETLLVESSAKNALILNQIRHGKEAPLTLSFPLETSGSPTVMDVGKVEGAVEGRDYRGAMEMEAITKVPRSPWSVIAKIDQDEVFAEIQRRALMVLVAVLLFSAACGSAMGFIWYRQNADFYKQLYAATLEKKAIKSHYEYLLKYANDVIILFNKDLKIVEANDKAVEIYGYSLDELLHKTAKDLRGEEGLSTMPKELEELEKHGSLVFNTVHKRKDGTTFPVEISTRVIVVEWQQFYQSIIRDISDRNT